MMKLQHVGNQKGFLLPLEHSVPTNHYMDVVAWEKKRKPLSKTPTNQLVAILSDGLKMQ
jgi:hypothetical protein